MLAVLQGPIQPSQEIRRTGGIVSELSLEYDTVLQCVFMDEDRLLRDHGPLVEEVHREGIEV